MSAGLYTSRAQMCTVTLRLLKLTIPTTTVVKKVPGCLTFLFVTAISVLNGT